LVSGLVRGFPASGGMSQSAVNAKAGACSPLSLVFASVAIGSVLLFLTHPLRELPTPILAAIVFMAVKDMIDLRALRHLRRINKIEYAVALVSLLVVITFGILEGLLLATIFSIVIGILVGVVAAWRRGTFADKGGLYTALAFYSMPTQWLGLMLIFFVAGAVGLPTSGIKTSTLGLFTDASTWAIFVDRLRHMILPALTLGLVLYGDYALIVRSAMLETLGEDYVLTARAKGLKNWTIVWKHGLRNAMLPIITLVALSLGFIIGGSITVEYVFSYPGLGLLTVEAIDKRDFPLLQAIFLLLTLSVIFFNLVADLLYFKFDPRVTA
jgi:ABC-type dipeptide/oligopeptide/nickel transport system permease component